MDFAKIPAEKFFKDNFRIDLLKWSFQKSYEKKHYIIKIEELNEFYPYFQKFRQCLHY